MSEDMAVSDNTTGADANLNSDEKVDSANVERDESSTAQAVVPEEAADMETLAAEDVPEIKPEPDPEPENPPVSSLNEDTEAPMENKHPTAEETPEIDEQKAALQKMLEEDIKQEVVDDDEINNKMVIDEGVDDKRGIKRRASAAFSDAGDEEFKGFDSVDENDVSKSFIKVLERLEAEVTEAAKTFTPLRHVMAKSTKRLRKDTDGSRPSSAMSSRSEGDDSSAASPAARGRRATTEMSSPMLRIPLEQGWKRELVYRAALDPYSRRQGDIYYYTPQGKKLRSTREVGEHLAGTGLTLENFSFFKEPLGVDDPDKEIIRDAKINRRIESPTAPPPAVLEGKRTPKPKPPKGASPEPATPKSPPAKLKVKSMGSRLSAAPPPASKPAIKKPALADNNNSAAWKKPSEEKKRGRPVANGAASPPAASPRRRGRPRAAEEVDHFTAFYQRAQENVVVQIFSYLGMRDLAHCARVCRLWRQLADTPSLWRHVRMKNSQVTDWGGLCAALKRHGTRWLDLRKMLLPQSDAVFWKQFAKHIAVVDTLERVELCRCPAEAVQAVCRGAPALRSLSALAIRDALLDPAPLAGLPELRELRLKSMAGLSLAADLSCLAPLRHLQHLSLTSIKELGWRACDVVGQLSNLESLELGECTFRAEFAAAVGKLTRLRRLRLERGTAQCAAPPILRALAGLPLLTRLELVNVDVKVGFDDALAECKNIERLLIIPTYVSQSATTNKQVLSGVLRLKESLTHLMWGVTIELLRVTELFIDQCEQGGEAKRRDVGECIPVLKPVPGCRLPADHPHVAGPPQVEILPLPTLQRLLSAQLPNTKLKLLRIPFHATWRQSLADFQ